MAPTGSGWGDPALWADAGPVPCSGSVINNQFYATATPLTDLTGTRSYCSADDLVIRLQPAGNVTLVGGYAACLALAPQNN